MRMNPAQALVSLLLFSVFLPDSLITYHGTSNPAPAPGTTFQIRFYAASILLPPVATTSLRRPPNINIATKDKLLLQASNSILSSRTFFQLPHNTKEHDFIGKLSISTMEATQLATTLLTTTTIALCPMNSHASTRTSSPPIHDRGLMFVMRI
jgi:hypothetical protein